MQLFKHFFRHKPSSDHSLYSYKKNNSIHPHSSSIKCDKGCTFDCKKNVLHFPISNHLFHYCAKTKSKFKNSLDRNTLRTILYMYIEKKIQFVKWCKKLEGTTIWLPWHWPFIYKTSCIIPGVARVLWG